jgi:phosphatidylglycerophosphatase A
VAGFAGFRLLDIAKPFPIGRLQRLPGGWGILADDLAAGLAVCAALRLADWLVPAWNLVYL